MGTVGAIKTTLGVSIATITTTPPGKYCQIMDVAANTGIIGAQFTNTGEPAVDSQVIYMIPGTTADGAIVWSWTSPTIPSTYLPKQ